MFKIKEWYLKCKKDSDVIISASPEFLLKIPCSKLNINLIASKVDKNTGIYDGKNCFGKEKVLRFREIYKESTIENFYSDSLSDTPLAQIAQKAYIVNGNVISEWKK